MSYQSRKSRNYWRQLAKLSPELRAAWLAEPPTVAPLWSAEAAPTPEELRQYHARNPVHPGCCWHCGQQLFAGCFACFWCGAELPIGQWKFPAIVWPEYDPQDAVMAFGVVGFCYGGRWLQQEFTLAEGDPGRREEILQVVANDPSAKRRANGDLLLVAVQNLLAVWQREFGFAGRVH